MFHVETRQFPSYDLAALLLSCGGAFSLRPIWLPLNSSVLPILCAGAAKCPVKAFCCYWFRPRNRSPHDLAAPLRRGFLLIRADVVHFGHRPRKRSGTDGFGHKVMCAKCRREAAISTSIRDWKERPPTKARLTRRGTAMAHRQGSTAGKK